MPGPAAAELSAPVTALSDALRMQDVVAVLREEGMRNGAELAVDLPGGPDDPAWIALLDRLYDTHTMRTAFDTAFAKALGDDPTMTALATAFFNSDIGQRAMKLEIDARRAMLDSDIEAAAMQAYQNLTKENPARVALLEQFVTVNDLIESNVMGSLNSNLAFYRGLAAAGDEQFAMSESDMLNSVWAEEAKAREETVKWLFPFLALAYQPLSDADLQAYIDFSQTMAGRRVNAAMFVAFDAVFDDISQELGRAVARQMEGQDI
jgi:hypothetical protein